MIFGPGDARKGGVTRVPDAILASMAERRTYIAHGEALAMLLALFHEPDVFRDSSVLWLLDNLGVLSCLCKGSSTVADFGCIVHTILLRLAGLDAMAFFDHVASADNVSDGGSRGCSILAEALGVQLIEKPLPPWPSNTVLAEPTEWLTYLGIGA
jgi:hypothetical protein